MASINWQEYNGEKFQVFCNDLLSFEFGKDYIPFSAPGGDKGIDGLFTGDYNKTTGKWRFQAKFKSPETGRQTSIKNLKQDIKSDLTGNVSDENNVILITNISIGPSKRAELVKYGEKFNSKVNFEIWDEAKINTILTHYPILKLWYTENARHLIQEYNEYYDEELKSNENSIYSFNNKFHLRNENLLQIDDFIKKSHHISLLIEGAPGIGKTRLCVEYFKRFVDNSSDWKALVLVSHKLDLELIHKSIQGESNYVILIDDADKFEETELADLITLVKTIQDNKIKLLFTVREVFTDRVFSKLPLHIKNKYTDKILITKFSSEETKKIIKDSTNVFDYYLDNLAETTRGIPIIISTLINHLKDGNHPNKINKDEFLNEYIINFFNQFTEKINKKNYIPQLEIRKTLEIVSLIEPLDFLSKNVIEKISEQEKVSYENVETIIKALKSHGILSGRYILEIKPDLYSDVILKKTINEEWLRSKFLTYNEFTSNIIQNVSYAFQEKENELLDRYISEYITQISLAEQYTPLEKVLSTIAVITQMFPNKALLAIKEMLNIYTSDTKKASLDFKTLFTQLNRNLSQDNVLSNVRLILRQLFYFNDFREEVFKLSALLYNELNDINLAFNIASFKIIDHLERYNCVRQSQVLTVTKKMLKGANSEIYAPFAVKVLSNLLKLEFTEYTTSRANNRSFNIHTILPIENKQVKKLRINTIEILVENYYGKHNGEHIKKDILKTILDIPREIFARRRTKDYAGIEEIELVLEFFVKISKAENFELRDREQVREQLNRYIKWGMDNRFEGLIKECVKNLTQNNLAEKILKLIKPEFDSQNLLRDQKDKISTELKELVLTTSVSDLAKSLSEVNKQIEYLPTDFFTVLNEIFISAKNLAFLNYLWENDQSFFFKFASSGLRQLRFFNEGQRDYWKYIAKLHKQNTLEAKNLILDVYHSFRIHNTFNDLGDFNLLDERDVSIIVGIASKCDEDSYFNLATALPTIFFNDSEKAINEINHFLEKCNVRHLEHLFTYIDPIVNDFFNDIKPIILQKTLKFNLGYPLQKFINRIIKEDGFNLVLELFKNRFLYKREYFKNDRYDFNYEYIPSHSGSYLTAELDLEIVKDIFKKSLHWFISLELEYFEEYYASNIIKELTYTKTIDEGLKSIYIESIEEFKSDYNKLLMLIKSLKVFERKNDNYIDLIICFLENVDGKIEGEKLEKFKSECYLAITSVGVKTGTSGQPFQVDIDLKELLEQHIDRSQTKPYEIKDFLKKVLKSINKTIESDSIDDSETEW